MYWCGSVSSAPWGTFAARKITVRITEMTRLMSTAVIPIETVCPNSMLEDEARCDRVGEADL